MFKTVQFNLYAITDLDQADFLMSGLKQLIQKLNVENNQLRNRNDSLEMENVGLADTNVKLLSKIKILEKKLSLKNIK